MNSNPIPPGAERTLAAALFCYAAQRPEHVANVLEGQALADRADGFTKRADLYQSAAVLLRGPSATYSVWQKAKLLGSAFAATWRGAVAEVDLEVEAREERARESHGRRRGAAELGTVLVLAVLAAAVLALVFASDADSGAVRWIAGGAAALIGAALVLDRVLAAVRVRRAVRELAEVDRAFAPPRALGSFEFHVWRVEPSGDATKLLVVSNLDTEERVRLTVERRMPMLDGIERWSTVPNSAWRFTSSGAFEREESSS